MEKRMLPAMLVLVAGFAFLSTSCTNIDNVAANASLTTTATDEAQAASLSDAVVNTADIYVNTLADNGYSTPAAVKEQVDLTGVTVTVDKKDSTSFPKIVTIDFGTVGYLDNRGDTIKGKIIITVSDKIWKSGATKTIKLVDFYVNGNNIKGSKSIVNNGLNPAKNPSYTITVSDTIIRVDKSTIIRNATRTRERIDNAGTPRIFWDDKFSITGSSSGVNAKGVAYTVAITNPLIIYNNYPYFVQGTVTTTTETRTAILDFGTGDKDRKATLTINGVTKDITLKH
ncbi:MAG: hypothetical protein WCQ44_13325 [Opitutaceae bacterium]